jgi:SAM-dependent methyltransferase
MTWHVSPEEWLLDFTSVPRGRVRGGESLDVIDDRLRSMLVPFPSALVMPSITGRSAPRPSGPPARACNREPSRPVTIERPPPPDPDQRSVLDVEIVHNTPHGEPARAPAPTPAPGGGMVIPSLTRHSFDIDEEDEAEALDRLSPEDESLTRGEIGIPDDDADDLMSQMAAGSQVLTPPPEDDEPVEVEEDAIEVSEPSGLVSLVDMGVEEDDDEPPPVAAEQPAPAPEKPIPPPPPAAEKVAEKPVPPPPPAEKAPEKAAPPPPPEKPAEKPVERAAPPPPPEKPATPPTPEKAAPPPPPEKAAPPPPPEKAAPPRPPEKPVPPPPAGKPAPPPVSKPVPAAAPTPTSGPNARKRGWFDEAFADHYANIMPIDSDASAELDAVFIRKTAELGAGQTVLDVGCGDGRHCFALANLGLMVTGLDYSLSQLVRASQRNEATEAGVTLLHGDMRSLPRDHQYDVVTCLGSTLGYFEGEEQNRQCLQELVEVVRPGGKLVLHVFNRDYLVAVMPCRSWWQGRGCLVLDVADMNYFTNRMRVHRTVVFEDGRQFEHHMYIRAFSLHELGKLLSTMGMRVLEVSGSRDTRGRFYGATSAEIWIVAQRRDDT